LAHWLPRDRHWILQKRSRRRTQVFKKLVSTAIMTSMVALTIPFAAGTAEAHPGCGSHRTRHRTTSRRTTYRRTSNYASTRYANGYSESAGNGYYTTSGTNYTTAKRPGYYSRHRRLVNTGLGAAAGALIGGLLGGRRGAGLGILAGGAGSQVFTHYQRPRNYARRY
jgi:hypothetical protein